MTQMEQVSLLGTNGGVFLSKNEGTTWAAVNNGLTNSVIRSLAVISGGSDSSGMKLLAGTQGGGIFLSTNNGGTWKAVNSGYTRTYALSFGVDHTNIFVGSDSGGVFLSTNGGISWSEVNAGLLNHPVWSIIVVPGDTVSNLFAGTDDGVFFSANYGTNWTKLDSSLANTNVWSLFANKTNLLAGTDEGVLSRSISYIITSLNNPSINLPERFSLSQNYPNPFNPTTTISFVLPTRSFVSLKVFDMLGREVSTIVSGELQAGSYTQRWNAANMASGVYFYRLQAGTYSETKKLLLLK